jgi:hypothetical protein
LCLLNTELPSTVGGEEQSVEEEDEREGAAEEEARRGGDSEEDDGDQEASAKEKDGNVCEPMESVRAIQVDGAEWKRVKQKINVCRYQCLLNHN